jgi:hypothetical protein
VRSRQEFEARARHCYEMVKASLPPPPEGASIYETIVPFQPAGNPQDLEFARGSALRSYHAQVSNGFKPLTPLLEVVWPEEGIVLFYFHAVPPGRH